MNRDPNVLTTSTNRNLFQPTQDHNKRRRTEVRQNIQKGKDRSNSRPRDKMSAIESKMTHRESDSESSHSARSQLVDLVVEDTAAEQAELVRARKEGGDTWNQNEQKHFVRTYDPDGTADGEQMRQGFDPRDVSDVEPPKFAVGEEEEDDDEESSASQRKPEYGSVNEERAEWDSSTPRL